MALDEMKQALREAVEALMRGEPVGMPTETVYGLAADALSPVAVAKIFQIKNRPLFDPLIVHLHSWEQVEEFAHDVPDQARRLTDRFWPGPLTILVPKRDSIPDLVTSGSPWVALRVPAHPLALALLREFGGPLAAPSANQFGRISPTTAQAVRDELGNEVKVVLDGGPCRVGIESTIVHLGEGSPRILRPGGISQEEIESVLGPIRTHPPVVPSSPPAPGNLDQHYAPRTPLRVLNGEEISTLTVLERSRCGLITWGQAEEQGFQVVRNLSEEGSPVQGASRLFQAMRELDGRGGGLDWMAARLWPETGLGRAINDRLRRAQGKRP